MSINNIYERDHESRFEDLFNQPGAVYRGTPFWSWNCTLNIPQLQRQIDVFKKMGLGGFHIHSRTGLGTAYLSDGFMEAVKACTEYAREHDMLAWLYDEDRWPSGAAGGLVTKDPRYRARYLLFTPFRYGDPVENPAQILPSRLSAARNEKGVLLARYAVTLHDGMLTDYRRLNDNEEIPSQAAIWYAYLEVAQDDPWFNGQTYLDTLNPEAVRQFINVTHARYHERLGEYFGTIIPAIFTDEPQFTHKTTLSFANERIDVTIPWTDDLAESYEKAYGINLLDVLPEIFWELPDGKASVARYRYHDHVCERFTQAFADQVGEWCEAHNLALSGHLMEEPTLHSQTHALGEAMRSYRGFHLAGIDMLCDRREYTTAKQAQSAAHQFGRNGVLSEIYGVTDWDYDFSGHKSQGDWQAALGVTVRVQHLAWVSMAGEAKRDYPASISYQSPWWEEYPLIEDHFARVNVALTQGKPKVRVGVLHPIESFWLCWGPTDQTGLERSEREFTFSQLTEWLLFGQIDFDYLCESLLPQLCPQQEGAVFRVGEMAYDAVIVPPMRTIRSATLERLEAFVKAGGKLLFTGEIPSLVDAEPSSRAQILSDKAEIVPFSQASVLRQLNSERELEVLADDGRMCDSLLHQIREDGEICYVFLCDTRRRGETGLTRKQSSGVRTRVRFRGTWKVELLDTRSGGILPVETEHSGGWTVIRYEFYPQGHLLVRLSPLPASDQAGMSLIAAPSREVARLTEIAPVTLSEPNALLLDQAEWRVNDKNWQPLEEILRLDNLARQQIGLGAKSGNIVQPWADTTENQILGVLALRYRIISEVQVERPTLAFEYNEGTHLSLNGVSVPPEINGWWVDEAISTIALPALSPGEHLLEFTIPYRPRTNIEWCYLLGDFGVRLNGRHARMIEPVRKLAPDDWTRQGLPFYTGNLTYRYQIEVEAGSFALRIPNFSGAMVGVTIDGRACPGIAFEPYETRLGELGEGRHQLELTVFGNRFNAFGALHSSVRQSWAGPPAWRTVGDQWCYEYMLRPLGLQTSPILLQTSRPSK